MVRHQKTCQINNALEKTNNELLKTLEETKRENNELLRENNELLKRELAKQGNTNITINVSILNQQYNNAMNLGDFNETIKHDNIVTIEDLNYTKNNGYEAGLSNILWKKFEQLGINKRPIHCSDPDKLSFVVRNDDKWVEDTEHDHINSTICSIDQAQSRQIEQEWDKLYPDDCIRLVQIVNVSEKEEKQQKYNKIKQILGQNTKIC
tara:strand:+ start:1505 stop:2128 length:624 start_codon:yes stop_codon:yes gene_type:complete